MVFTEPTELSASVMDIVLRNGAAYRGFVTQESIGLQDFLANDFGACFR